MGRRWWAIQPGHFQFGSAAHKNRRSREGIWSAALVLQTLPCQEKPQITDSPEWGWQSCSLEQLLHVLSHEGSQSTVCPAPTTSLSPVGKSTFTKTFQLDYEYVHSGSGNPNEFLPKPARHLVRLPQSMSWSVIWSASSSFHRSGRQRHMINAWNSSRSFLMAYGKWLCCSSSGLIKTSNVMHFLWGDMTSPRNAYLNKNFFAWYVFQLLFFHHWWKRIQQRSKEMIGHMLS